MTAAGRILVVDDEAFNRDLFEQELEALGHSSMLAADGEAALALLSEHEVDLVLLDIMMPGIDGFEVLRRMRADPLLRDVPVIVVSALHDLANTVRGIELGADDYLPKPFEPVLLKARIDACLERHRWRLRERAYLIELERERARADALLEALLPREALVEWHDRGGVTPRSLERVVVMFLDIVGFSRLALTLTPEETVERLTRFTVEAESLAEAEGLEKIKLVGDAVMLTGNLLVPHPEALAACVSFARRLSASSAVSGCGWRLRGGLAFGPVVAGVIGHRRFSFDLWGPTVNLAARLAALPGPGSLHIDETARNHLDAAEKAQPLGPIELRSLGPTPVYRIDLNQSHTATASS